MIELGLPQSTAGRPLKVLCIGCHSDDIEIGCGGTLLRLASDGIAHELHWAVFSAAGVREAEARKAAAAFGGDRLRSEPLLLGFRDGFMPYQGAEIKDAFESKLKPIAPDLVFTHFGNDAHQDHRLISELSWNTFRNHLILEYEIPKYDADLGNPNVFVGLGKAICEEKCRLLMEAFGSQRSKHWFDDSTFMALARIRGMQSNARDGYAEAFYSRKILL